MFIVFSVMLYCSFEAYGQLPEGNLGTAVKPEACMCAATMSNLYLKGCYESNSPDFINTANDECV